VSAITCRRELGAALLADAALRAPRSEFAIFALVVDAKDDPTVALYRHHGLETCGVQPSQPIASSASFSGSA
jgi:ribosomal protein S18 acetylase RimI-like enzyme